MNYDNIPYQLKCLKQWVCALNGSKVPMKAYENFPASSTNSNTWSDFNTAIQACNSHYYDYLGFVFNDNGFVGIDIDDGLDDDGFPSDLAVDIINHCKSYTEHSRSGRGYHIIVGGTIPFKGKNNLAGVEIYKTSRYFIMTGETMIYQQIADNQEAIDYVLKKYFPEQQKERKSTLKDGKIYHLKWNKPGDKIPLKPIYPQISNGSRNICLTSLAGNMHTIGYSKQQIYKELQYVNQTACKPKLDISELQTICNSVTRYRR